MTLGEGIILLVTGKKIAREGWNGKNMWLVYVPERTNIMQMIDTPYYSVGVTGPITINAHIDMMTADGSIQPGWLASQSDLLANDYYVV